MTDRPKDQPNAKVADKSQKNKANPKDKEPDTAPQKTKDDPFENGNFPV